MIGTANLPSLSQLYDLIDAVPSYPISAGQLTMLARKKGADWRVVNFYKSFPERTIFREPEELAARSEQVEILNLDSQPKEQLLSPE